MSERTRTTPFMAACRRVMRGCELVKHSDKFTKGVPDTSITWMGRTAWVEVKDLKHKMKKTRKDSVQVMTCHRLSVASNGLCWFIALGADRAEVWEPRARASLLWPRVFHSFTHPKPKTVIIAHGGYNISEAVAAWIAEEMRSR